VRETDTMDTFMLLGRGITCVICHRNMNQGPFSTQPSMITWMPLTHTTGALNMPTMHLPNTRASSTSACVMRAHLSKGNEPMMQLRNQGMVLGGDGDKDVEEPKGNVIAPDILGE